MNGKTRRIRERTTLGLGEAVALVVGERRESTRKMKLSSSQNVELPFEILVIISIEGERKRRSSYIQSSMRRYCIYYLLDYPLPMHKICFPLQGAYPLSQPLRHNNTSTRMLIVVGPPPKALLAIWHPIALH